MIDPTGACTYTCTGFDVIESASAVMNAELYGRPPELGVGLGKLQMVKSAIPPPEFRFQRPAQMFPVGEISTSWLFVVP